MNAKSGSNLPVNDNGAVIDVADDTAAFACEQCEILRIFSRKALTDMFGDLGGADVRALVGREIIKCEKEFEGYRDRCHLFYFRTLAQRIEQTRRPVSTPTRASLMHRDVPVAGCKVCRNIKTIPNALLNMLDIHDPLTNLIPRLKCSRCKQKDAYIAVVRRPY